MRPHGRGLFSYLYHQYIVSDSVSTVTTTKGSSTGGSVYGYDPIQGAFAPSLRFLLHVTTFSLFWSILLKFIGMCNLVPTTIQDQSLTRPLIHVLRVGAVACILYLFYFWILFHFLPGVSHPGYARKRKIDRHPQWIDYHDNNDTHQNTDSTSTIHKLIHVPVMPDSLVKKKWQFIVGMKSHAISEHQQQHHLLVDTNTMQHTQDCKQTTQHTKLTGEPSGRDVWTTFVTTSSSEAPQLKDSTIKKNTHNNTNNKSIEEMASGGRPYLQFRPSVNPNRYVQPYIFCCAQKGRKELFL